MWDPTYVRATLNSESLSVEDESGFKCITVPNKPAGHTITLRKRDASNDSKCVVGAQFKIYTVFDENDSSKCEVFVPQDGYLKNSSSWNSEENVFTTDENGMFYFGYLPLGSYYLEEIVAPDGYELLAGTALLEITADKLYITPPGGTRTSMDGKGISGNVDIWLTNVPIGSISICKTVQLNGSGSSELQGKTVRFGLYESVPAAADSAKATYTMTLGSETATTETAFTGLHMGTYYVYELDENNHPILNGGSVEIDGKTYTVSETTPNVTLSAAGDKKTVEITNKRSSVDVGILKIDEADWYSEEFSGLPNAEFTLTKKVSSQSDVYALDGSNGSVFLTNSNGEINITGLPDGEYCLEETEAPAGYILVSDPCIYFKISDGTLTWTDKSGTEITSGTGFVRYDSSNKKYTVGNKAGAALPAAGGPGTRLFTIIGSILALGAGLLLVRRRRFN